MNPDEIAKKYGGSVSIDDVAAKFGGSAIDTQQEDKEVGFFHGVAQEMASPFLQAGVTVAGAGLTGLQTLLGDKAKADETRKTLLNEGVDFGWFGSNVKPLGADAFNKYKSGEYDKGEAITRMALDAAGNLAEIYSYGLAPIEGLGKRGIWKTIKAATPMASALGTGKALQSFGEGQNVKESAIQGGVSFGSAVLGYGLLKGGANIIGTYGARALQQPAIIAVGKQLDNFAGKVWSTLPEAFTETAENLVSKGVQGTSGILKFLTAERSWRTFKTLESEYNANLENTVRTWIDKTLPEISENDRLSLYNAMQSAVKKQVGMKFDAKDLLYEQIKPVPLGSLDNFQNELNTTVEGLSSKLITGLKSGSQNNFTNAFGYLTEIQGVLGKGKATVGDILNLWDRSKIYMLKASNEEASIIRETGMNLFKAGKEFLSINNPEALNTWNLAYQKWLESTNLSESPVIKIFNKYGNIDSMIPNLLGEKMTLGEQEIFTSAINSNPEMKRTFTDLVMNSLMRNVRGMTPEEGSKFIDSFLSTWKNKTDAGNILLTNDAVNYLSDMSEMMKGKFEDFIFGIRDSKGIGQKTFMDLESLKNQMNISQTINEGGLEKVSDNFIKNLDNPNTVKLIESYSPEEKKVLGMSLFSKVYDDSMVIMESDGKGGFNITKDFVKAVNDSLQKVKSLPEEARNMLFVQSQIDQFDNLARLAEKATALKDFGKEPSEKVLEGFMGTLYMIRGWIPGALRNIGSAVIPSSEEKAYLSALESLIEENVIKKNGALKMRDFLNYFLPISGQALSEVTTSKK